MFKTIDIYTAEKNIHIHKITKVSFFGDTV